MLLLLHTYFDRTLSLHISCSNPHSIAIIVTVSPIPLPTLNPQNNRLTSHYRRCLPKDWPSPGHWPTGHSLSFSPLPMLAHDHSGLVSPGFPRTPTPAIRSTPRRMIPEWSVLFSPHYHSHSGVTINSYCLLRPQNGGYVNPPPQKRQLRDPYGDWWDKQGRRNYGEPVRS